MQLAGSYPILTRHTVTQSSILYHVWLYYTLRIRATYAYTHPELPAIELHRYGGCVIITVPPLGIIIIMEV